MTLSTVHRKSQGDSPAIGHLFVSPEMEVADEDAISINAVLYADLEPFDPPPGPPGSCWRLNELGQPEWLVGSEWSQLGSAWNVIVPPRSGASVHPDFLAARSLDRQEQFLDRWGAGRGVGPELDRVRDLGPAFMPAVPMSADQPRRRGRPNLEWGKTEVACAVAWLFDICAWKKIEIHRALFSVSLDLDDSDAIGKVRRYVAAGRQALCFQGVWPWFSIPLDDPDPADDGQLPENWVESVDVQAHLDAWHMVGCERFEEREESVADVLAGSGTAPAPW